MSLADFTSLTGQLRWALARDPANVGPLLQEMTACLQALPKAPRPPRALILKTWRQNRALLQMLESALAEADPLRIRA